MRGARRRWRITLDVGSRRSNNGARRYRDVFPADRSGDEPFVLSRARLLDRLHGTDRWIGGRTIDTHVKNLRAKIEDDPQNPTRLVTVYGVGYTLQAG
ncbi:winged helix-turn-helix domain-containing protein [Agreia pratensis]|nr:winged helix-turn-helix domain-containing protein [Agreia pratensis]